MGHTNFNRHNANQTIFNSIAKDGFLHVKGRTEDYRGTLQLVIEACRPIPLDKINLADFLPVTELDVEAMWSALLEILREVKDEWLRAIIKKFVEDREMVAAFKKAPASMTLHQPFVGGLLLMPLGILRRRRAFVRSGQAPADGYPKLVLLDLKLPRVGGIEVLRRLKASERTRLIPVVVMTSSREESDLVASYKYGANSYIVKPVDFEQFMKAVGVLGLYWMLFNEVPR